MRRVLFALGIGIASACSGPAATTAESPPEAPPAGPTSAPEARPVVEAPAPEPTRQDRYAELCARAELGACRRFLASPESDASGDARGDAREDSVRARLAELLGERCHACISGEEAECDPSACRALDPDDSRVTGWLERRCEPAPATPISPTLRGFACIAAAGEPSRPGRDAERLRRLGARLLDEACAAGSYEACAEMASRYFDGGGPHGEMNEALGEERATQALTLATAACEASEARACMFVELERARLAP